MDYVMLNNGVKMPKLDYGVYQVDASDTERCVLEAISVGYRSIDTAQAYGCVAIRNNLYLETREKEDA